MRTSVPAARADAVSESRSASRPAAAVSSAPPRNNPIIACISSSASTLFARTASSTVSARSGSAPRIRNAASLWIAIADRYPATASCNSRASRRRSSDTAASRSISAIRASADDRADSASARALSAAARACSDSARARSDSARACSAAAVSRCRRSDPAHHTGVSTSRVPTPATSTPAARSPSATAAQTAAAPTTSTPPRSRLSRTRGDPDSTAQ